jgi:hypothetical protein
MSAAAQPPFATPLSPEAKDLLGRFDSLWQQQQRPCIDEFLASAVIVELATFYSTGR